MRNLTGEAWLRERGFTFDYREEVALSEIAIDDAAVYQIRLGHAVNQDQLGMYRLAFEDGADFPAPFVYADNGRYPVLDGIHRVTAARAAGKKTLDAYVVNVSNVDEIDEIRRQFNMTNGMNYSSAERVEQALHLVGKGWTAVDAGRAFKVSDSVLTLKLRAQRGLNRIIEAGTNLNPAHVMSLMPTQSLAAVESVARNDVVLKVVSTVARLKKEGAKFDSKFIETLLRDGRRISTDAGAKAFMEKVDRDYPPRPARVNGNVSEERALVYRARVQRQKFLTYVDKNLMNARLTNAERRQVVKLLREASVELAEKAGKIANKSNDATPGAGAGRGRQGAGAAAGGDRAALA